MEDKMTEPSNTKGVAERQPMPEQPAEIRRRNFGEVPLGYTTEMAVTEAKRCLQCKKPNCVQGCPVGIDIPGFIHQIVEGDFTAAHKVDIHIGFNNLHV